MQSLLQKPCLALSRGITLDEVNVTFPVLDTKQG